MLALLALLLLPLLLLALTTPLPLSEGLLHIRGHEHTADRVNDAVVRLDVPLGHRDPLDARGHRAGRLLTLLLLATAALLLRELLQRLLDLLQGLLGLLRVLLLQRLLGLLHLLLNLLHLLLNLLTLLLLALLTLLADGRGAVEQDLIPGQADVDPAARHRVQPLRDLVRGDPLALDHVVLEQRLELLLVQLVDGALRQLVEGIIPPSL